MRSTSWPSAASGSDTPAQPRHHRRVLTLDTPDALLFDQTVGRIAHELHHLGDTDTIDVRRARAVGILADPQYALDLMSGREDAAPPPSADRVVNSTSTSPLRT